MSKKCNNIPFQRHQTFHRVNILDLYTSYIYLHTSCEVCKMYDMCRDINYKSEVCKVAAKTQRILGPFLQGHVDAFAVDEFYVDVRHRKYKEIKNFESTVAFLRKLFLENNNVRK